MKLSALCPVPLPDLPFTEHIVIERGVRHRLDGVLDALQIDDPHYVFDDNTAPAFGFDSTNRKHVYLGPEPHADAKTVASVAKSLEDASSAVAIGSGTVNDLVKRAATMNQIPYVACGTAASMNGYASGIAAILDDGVKTTVPANPPIAIVLDTDVLAQAPARLTQAGLGDLISKPVSDSDWWLANAIEKTGYSSLPSKIVDHAVHAAVSAASGLPARVPEAHGALGEALILSGVAMVAAGSSSPASGGEHLISHLWDMENVANGKATRLHGAQVGVATCISAALYAVLLNCQRPEFQEPPTWAEESARIKSEHGPLAEAILRHAENKHRRAHRRVAYLRDHWPEIREQLAERDIPSPQTIRNILDSAGAPATLKALGESKQNTARVFRLARDIRDRVTVLDVAFELGILPKRIDEILALSGVA